MNDIEIADATKAGPLDVGFIAEVLKSSAKGGWTYLIWPESPGFFGTRARVKVVGTIEGQSIRTSFMPLGDGRHKLPVTGELLAAAGKGVGDEVSVRLTERL